MVLLFSCVFVLLALQIDLIDADCNVVPREEWMAVKPKHVHYLPRPVELVVIHHTNSRNCGPGNYVSCSDLVTDFQMRHMKYLNASDIGYSFLIGGDSKVHEGAGWLHISNETDGFSREAISIAFIGNFNSDIPSTRMMRTVKDFLKCGVENGHLTSNYLVVAQRQLFPNTNSPGENVYNEIMKWSEWERDASAIKGKVLGVRYA